MAKQAFSSYFSVFSAFFSCFCLLNERNSLYLPAEKENFINNIHFFKREIMNKTELIDKIAAGAGLTKADAKKALDATTAAIKDALAAGDKIQLVGFGTFSVTEKAAHDGINPATKQKIKIAAKKVAKFKAGAELADAVNK